MPLPVALAAKLAKRGIITPKSKSETPPKKKKDFKGFSICPNKNNVFHECTPWCETHWKGFSIPDPQYSRNIHKMLAKYPLPNHWTEIFDRGIGRYYFWDMETDMVSWLPPKHPKSQVTKTAAKLREEHITQQKEHKRDAEKKENMKEREVYKLNEKEMDKEKDKDRADADEDNERSYKRHSDRRERDKDRDDRRSKREKDDRYRSSKRPKSDALDPMDPAAYSDIPRGTWSDGLETNKGRADNTASGVLFQQRPYPAPGAVLAANKERQDKK